jgi:ABC-type xylose transport system substrate-binding protein
VNKNVYPLFNLYELISKNGHPTTYGKALDGIEVTSDPEGYHLEFHSKGVEIVVGFHNTYKERWERKVDLDQFYKKADSLIKQYGTKTKH